YVADGCASGRAAESSVRDKGYAGTKSHTGDRRGGIQHFPHSRAAFWPFITDNHHISRMDLAAFDRNDRVFFTVKDSGRSFVYQHLVHNSGALHYASVRRQVAFQHGKAAGL